MINSSKKNMVSTPKQHSHKVKLLKRSKSTEHLLPKKIHKKPLTRGISEQSLNHASLNKTKSTKSLKPKSKQTTKSQHCSGKNAKAKKSSDSKTVKIGYKNKDINEVSSILTEQWQVKKPLLEYFMYQNNCIPIENSAQRRFVYKIQMIDMENKTTSSNFNCKKMENKEVSTSLVDTQEIAIGESIESTQNQAQTDPIQQPQKQFVVTKIQENAQKCFIDVLTELEFLFLPNEQNFKPFSPNERVHYSELLEALAKKMLSNGKQIVHQTLTVEQITVLLYQREGIQVGAMQYIPPEGFPTHLPSILAYLKNLFCFIQYGFKDEVLASLRMFYGFNYNERVRRLSRGVLHQKDLKLVLSEQIFESFQHQMFKDYEFASQIAKQSVHAHNRAIFDSVNAQLQAFRPFFSSQGEPFPWTNNLGMTHYDITEEALYIIFVQIKQKIQRQVLTLCGIHLDFDDQSIPRAEQSPFYQKKMQQRSQKMIFQDIKQIDDRVDLDYENSKMLFELSNLILDSLLFEAYDEIINLKSEVLAEEEFQFQYFN